MWETCRGVSSCSPASRNSLQELVQGGEDVGRVVPDVRRDELPRAADRGGRFQKLAGIHPRLIADPEGDADAAALQGFPDPARHAVALGGGGGGVAVQAAGLVPEEAVTGQHGHVHRGAVPVDEIEIVRRVELVLAAVARDGGGHAHVQHAGEDRLLIIGLQPPFRIDGVLVHVNVKKARADDLPGGVDHLVGAAGGFGNAISVEPEIPDFMHAGGGVDDGSVLN